MIVTLASNATKLRRLGHEAVNSKNRGDMHLGLIVGVQIDMIRGGFSVKRLSNMVYSPFTTTASTT